MEAPDAAAVAAPSALATPEPREARRIDVGDGRIHEPHPAFVGSEPVVADDRAAKLRIKPGERVDDDAQAGEIGAIKHCVACAVVVNDAIALDSELCAHVSPCWNLFARAAARPRCPPRDAWTGTPRPECPPAWQVRPATSRAAVRGKPVTLLGEAQWYAVPAECLPQEANELPLAPAFRSGADRPRSAIPVRAHRVQQPMLASNREAASCCAPDLAVTFLA